MITRWSPPWDVLVGVTRTAPFEDGEIAEAAGAILDQQELADAASAATPVARAEHLAGHVLARTLLAERAACRPGEIELHLAPPGQSVAVGPRSPQRLSFSIAHSDGIALCAVTAEAAVGADVESLRHVGRDPLAFADGVCSAPEKQELRETPRTLRAERLLTMWTVKEAMSKAAGPGADLSLDDIAIATRCDGISLVRWGWGTGEMRSMWRVISLRPTDDHVASVAVLVGSENGPAGAYAG
jgi:4'-phosphopantetheinyl transferase